MKLHELRPAVGGGTKAKKRLGRGTATGQGKTSGRGQKGQGARSGGGVRPGFEGGQMPLMRRLPKIGFDNTRFEKKYSVINIDRLNDFEDGTVVDAQLLKDRKVIKKIEKDGLKVLGNGEFNKKITIKASKFTKSAIKKIEAAGGKVEVI